jgi:hypothetical protein
VSEIVLPIALPYLTIPQRVKCAQVCKAWKFVISEQGVAQHIDVNDASSVAYQALQNKNRESSPSFFEGILRNSYPSLQRLFLHNYQHLEPAVFHCAIPHLRKLNQLDVSRCAQLNDQTLLLIAEHLNKTLEVLYMKGLRKVTDVGMTEIARSCTKLRVLEISNVPITDASGIELGKNLHNLEALYMRDNYLLTNQTVIELSTRCRCLQQLTLWGCIRITNIIMERGQHVGTKLDAFTPRPEPALSCSISQTLVLLNLWGCHGLRDDSFLLRGKSEAGRHETTHDVRNNCGTPPTRLASPFKNLRILIVSECHQLTDKFVVSRSTSILRNEASPFF